MDSEGDVQLVLGCDGCNQRILVDEEMRRTLLDVGSCPVCDEPISDADFEQVE